MDYFEQIVDSIDWTPELFLGICLISAAVLFLSGMWGWDYRPGLPKYENPPPPPKKDAYLGYWEIKDGKFYRLKNPPKETGT